MRFGNSSQYPAKALRLILVAVVAAGFATFGPRQARAQDEAAQIPPEVAQAMFEGYCGVCHGPSGRGGALGPSLLDTRFSQAADSELARLISKGNVAAGMPSFGRGLTRDEIGAFVGYLRVLQNKAAEGHAEPDEPSPVEPGGDAQKGEALFRGKAGCAGCHTTFYVGKSIGPDLSDLALHDSYARIYQGVAHPSAEVPVRYRGMEIETADREKIRGRFRNDTPETVQILQDGGDLWVTYFKNQIKSSRVLRDESLMPTGLLDPLTSDETRDLFAYLYDLR